MNVFSGDLPEVLLRAQSNNIGFMIDPGVDLASSTNCVKLAHEYEEIFAAVGIHPNDITDTSIQGIQNLKQLLSDDKVVAVGEVGLDYFHGVPDKKQQHNVFIKQIELAILVDKPMIIHSRDAINDVITVLNRYFHQSKNGLINGIIHSFEGNIVDARTLLDLGFGIGIGGPVTFKNSKLKVELVRDLPLESIFLETDSPYLAPVPQRGQRNEPANIKFVVEKIAKIKECDIKQVEIQTTINAIKMFRIGDEIDRT